MSPQAFGAVARAVGAVLPLGFEPLELPLGLVCAQCLAQGLRQRQALANAGQGAEVQAVGTDLQRTRAGAVALPAQAHRTTGPVLALGGGKLQVVAEHRMPIGGALIAHAAAHIAQVQGRESRAQLQLGALKRQVGGDVGDLHRRDVDPGLDRTHPSGKRVGIAAQLRRCAQPRRVQARCVHIDLARPLLPAPVVQAQQGLSKLPAQAQPLAPARRRRGVHAHVVAVELVAQHGGDVLQPHRLWARPGIVAPAHPPLADLKLGLREKPVQGAAGSTLAQALTGHAPLALGIAAHVDLQAFQVHLLKRQTGERAQ